MKLRALMVVMGFVLCVPCPAALLWDNHLEHDSESGGRAFGGSNWRTYIVADNFSLLEPAVLEEIRFEALINDDFAMESASIWLYDDLSRGEGLTPPENPRLLGAFEGTGFNTGRRDRNRFVWRFSVPFGAELPPGDYYIGLHLNGPGTDAWWATSSGGQGADTPGWFSPDLGQTWIDERRDHRPPAYWDHAFEIHGTVIPEPATLLTLGAALVALARSRKKR